MRNLRLTGSLTLIILGAGSGFASSYEGTVTAIGSGTFTMQAAQLGTNPYNSTSAGSVTVSYTSNLLTSGPIILDDVVQVDGTLSTGNITATSIKRLVYGVPSVQECYVATTGSDTTGNGSPATPYATITYGAHQCTLGTNGVIVHVAPGSYTNDGNALYGSTYHGSAVLDRSGTSEKARIRVVSDQPWQAQIVTNAAGNSGGVVILGSYIDLINFSITDPTAGDGIYISAAPAYNPLIYGNILQNINTTPTTCVAGSGIRTGSTGTTRYGSIIANAINNVGNLPYWILHPTCAVSHGISLSFDNEAGNDPNNAGWIVQNNIISNVATYGIRAYPHGCNNLIANNTIFVTGAAGILVSLDSDGALSGCAGNGTLNSNIIVSSGQQTTTLGGAIELYYSGGTTSTASTYTLNNNLFISNASNITLVGAGISGTPVENNDIAFSGSATAVFTNYQASGTGDYHLATGSVAIGQGAPNACRQDGLQ